MFPPTAGAVGTLSACTRPSERFVVIARHRPPRPSAKLFAAGLLAPFVLFGLTDAAPPEAESDKPDPPPAATDPAPANAKYADLIASLKLDLSPKEPVTVPESVGRWGEAVRRAADIGDPLVPHLVVELDRTTEPMNLRTLAFTLRALGDPRAVPALIRAIPRTLVPVGSDLGLSTGDEELDTFLRGHDQPGRSIPGTFSLGRPYPEVLSTLVALTGRTANAEDRELLTVHRSELPGPRRAQERLFRARAEDWAAWWADHAGELTDGATPPAVGMTPVPDGAQREEPDARPFPTGPGVALAGDLTHSGVILGPPGPGVPPRQFYDLDTGRVAGWPDTLPAFGEADPAAVDAWAAQRGFDLVAARGPDEAGRRPAALRAVGGLRVWPASRSAADVPADADVRRVVEALRAASDPRLGDPVDPLLPAAPPEGSGPYLFLTREGTPGVLNVGPEVTDLLRRQDEGGLVGLAGEGHPARGPLRGVPFNYGLLTRGDRGAGE